MSENSGAPVAESIQRRWAQAFARSDVDALASLYTQDALFFGSKPDLYRGQGGVREYFESLTKGYESATFAHSHVVAISPEVIVSAGFVTFAGAHDGRRFSLPYRMSWTLVRSGGEWRIASHHASPRN
jgi:uncharacterized protein (TIGR02246 family)